MTAKVIALRDIRGDIEKMAVEFAKVLPPQLPTERFVRHAHTAVMTNPQLLNADRLSLRSALMKAAQDGLLPDGREGAIVMYGDKASWMPMVAGLLKKARNSGEIASINAHIVYANDRCHIVLGDDEKIEHEPYLDGDRGEPRLVYSICKLKDGTVVRAWMTVAEVEKIRSISRSAKKGPWVDHWAEMAKKTVIRRLCKVLPASTDKEGTEAFMRVAERDDEMYEMKDARDVTPPSAHLRQAAPPPEPVEVVDQHGQAYGILPGDVATFFADRAGECASDEELQALLDGNPGIQAAADAVADERARRKAEAEGKPGRGEENADQRQPIWAGECGMVAVRFPGDPRDHPCHSPDEAAEALIKRAKKMTSEPMRRSLIDLNREVIMQASEELRRQLMPDDDGEPGLPLGGHA